MAAGGSPCRSCRAGGQFCPECQRAHGGVGRRPRRRPRRSCPRRPHGRSGAPWLAHCPGCWPCAALAAGNGQRALFFACGDSPCGRRPHGRATRKKSGRAAVSRCGYRSVKPVRGSMAHKVSLTARMQQMIVPIYQNKQVSGWVLAVPYMHSSSYPATENDCYSERVRSFYNKLFNIANEMRSSGQPIIAMGHLTMHNTLGRRKFHRFSSLGLRTLFFI